MGGGKERMIIVLVGKRVTWRNKLANGPFPYSGLSMLVGVWCLQGQ